MYSWGPIFMKPDSTTKPTRCCRRLWSWTPNRDSCTFRGQILLARGRPQEALVEIQQETNDWFKSTGEAFAYHSLGRQQASEAALRELIARYGGGAAYEVAGVYAYRGEVDKALEWLDRAYQQHDSGLTYLKSDGLVLGPAPEPAYIELLKKMALPL